jgi:DNA-binding NtrC family response regulator
VLPPGVVIALPAPLEELVKSERISTTLARWFDDTQFSVPRLADRAEDLFALSLDILARRCLELGKPPLGIDSFALRALLEHTWPGNDIELGGVLGRVAAVASGPTVTASDLESIGFAPTSARAPEKASAAAPARRRPSRRPLR